MKRIFKIIAVSVCIAVMTLSLTGCNAIDEMRASHGIWTNDGNIRLGKHEYIKLPESETLSPFFDEYKYVYVTESGVPLLLSAILGEECYLSNDEKIIQITEEANWTKSNYCRKDAYETIKSLIEGGVITDGYCYSYEVYDEDYDWLWKTEWYVLSDIEVDAVNKVIMTVTPIEIGEEGAYDLYGLYDYEYGLSLESCSEDLLFKGEGYDLYKYGDTYCLANSSDSTYTYYIVPDDLTPIFADIMSAYIEAEEESQEMYDYYY